SRPGLGTGRGGCGLRPIVLGWQCRLWVPRPASKPEKLSISRCFSGLPPKADLPPDLRTTPAANSSRTPPSRPRATTRSRAPTRRMWPTFRGGSALIAFARVELHASGKHASARNKVRFQANAIRVFEQHRVIARCPCAVLRRMNDGSAHLTQQIV